MGTIFLVGAGPGDFKLITLKAFELLQKADVIIYDYLINQDLLNICKENADLIYVGKKASQHELPQSEINRLLLQKAKSHDIVVRLKGGDPFVFGRGGEEALFLVEHGIAVEVVPGVTSATSVPAYAGIPLTHRNYASTVAFITGQEDTTKVKSTIQWKELARGIDTLVFLMGVKNLPEIKKNLIEGGKDPLTPASVIQWGTLSKQKVVTGTLNTIDILVKEKGMKPPAVIVIGKIVELRNKLNWFEQKPLFGKTIAVTRAPHQSLKLGELLSEKGAQVIYIPTIEITPIIPNRKLKQAIDSLHTYNFIIFTSVNSVSLFFNHLMKYGRDTRALHGIKIIPIGNATAMSLLSKGVIPDFLPEEFSSEGIIKVLQKMDIRNKRFLLPKAKESRNVIVEYITKEGGICNTVSLYKTVVPKKPSSLTEKPDIITFTSSSTVDNFITLYGDGLLKESIIASIGPVTTERLKENNIRVHIEAKRYNISGIVEAIEEYVLP